MSEAKKGHVLFFPYPLQGHINPMIQLAKRLSKKGITSTLIIASKDHREPYTSDDYSITVHTIHDGFFPHEHPHAKFVDLDRFHNSTSRSLTDFISRYNTWISNMTYLLSYFRGNFTLEFDERTILVKNLYPGLPSDIEFLFLSITKRFVFCLF